MGCGDSNLQATSSAMHLQSPYYPSEYDLNSVCEWLITSDGQVSIQVKDIDLEECCDSVQLFDGFSDQDQEIVNLKSIHMNETFNSSGSVMYIRFTSDKSVVKRGFQLEYSGINTRNDSSMTYIIVGVVIGVLAIVCIFIVVFRRYR